MHTEIGGDLLESHAGITATSYTNDVVAELTGIWLGHVDILSGRPPRQARSGVTRPRGSPVLGLRWADVDLSAGNITIRSTRIRHGAVIEASTPKTAKGNRTISLGPATVAALRSWRTTQSAERLRLGSAWNGNEDLVVTNADGSAPNPEAFSNMFRHLVREAQLPPIRFHDLRHSYATNALATDVPVKVLSQRLGHADVAVTLKVYAHVLPGDDEEAARRAEAVLGL
jgi:integrase